MARKPGADRAPRDKARRQSGDSEDPPRAAQRQHRARLGRRLRQPAGPDRGPVPVLRRHRGERCHGLGGRRRDETLPRQSRNSGGAPLRSSSTRRSACRAWRKADGGSGRRDAPGTGRGACRRREKLRRRTRRPGSRSFRRLCRTGNVPSWRRHPAHPGPLRRWTTPLRPSSRRRHGARWRLPARWSWIRNIGPVRSGAGRSDCAT
jgi:hypothetical protein